MSGVGSSEQVAAGFAYRLRKNGEVEVSHHGRSAAVLRGKVAAGFIAQVSQGGDQMAQELMARVTGNYKRGNERIASQHPRAQR